MQKAEMVREQWLELKIFFLRCLYCRVICSFVLLLWLQLCMVKWLCSSENGTGRSFFSKACNFGWESFWRCRHVYWSLLGCGGHYNPMSPSLGECFCCREAGQLLSFWRKAAASAMFFRALTLFVACQLCWGCQWVPQERQVWDLI